MLNLKKKNYSLSIDTSILFLILTCGLFLNLGINFMYFCIFIYCLFNLKLFKSFDTNYLCEKFIYFFFIYLNLNALFNYFFKDYYGIELLIKCILFNKIIILYIVLKHLILKITFEKLKKVFFAINFLIFFLILDLLFQSYFLIDFFNFKVSAYGRLTGPYGDELVPGFLIFSLGSISYFLFIFQDSIYKRTFIFISLYILFFITILLTGERMVFIGSIMFLFFLFIFLIKFKKKIFISNIILFVLIIFTLNYNNTLNLKYKSFLKQLNLSVDKSHNHESNKESSFTEGNNNKIPNVYINIFKSGYQVWKNYPIFGSGFGSFRVACNENTNIEKSLRCNTHPHNIYLEVLSETGVIGFVLFFFIILSILLPILRLMLDELFIKKKFNILNLTLLISFLIMLVNVWPIKSTGRLFSNFYGTIFWINLFLCNTLYFKIKNKLNI